MNEHEIIRSDYASTIRPFPIQAPNIPSGSVYFFYTESCLEYEVRFGQKKDNCLGHVVNFGVLNDEFENEYSLTNKGETFRIIATVIEIIKLFHANHPTSNSYEFTGEFKSDENKESSIRSRLYYRIACRVLACPWHAEMLGNKVVVTRLRHPI